MAKFTVISIATDNGQILCDHVEAEDGMNAFANVVATRGVEIELVVAIEGTHNEEETLTFPGESVVDGQTVADQPEVFGEGEEEV